MGSSEEWNCSVGPMPKINSSLRGNDTGYRRARCMPVAKLVEVVGPIDWTMTVGGIHPLRSGTAPLSSKRERDVSIPSSLTRGSHGIVLNLLKSGC